MALGDSCAWDGCERPPSCRLTTAFAGGGGPADIEHGFCPGCLGRAMRENERKGLPSTDWSVQL